MIESIIKHDACRLSVSFRHDRINRLDNIAEPAAYKRKAHDQAVNIPSWMGWDSGSSTLAEKLLKVAD